MKVAITANRDIPEEMFSVLKTRMAELCSDSNIEEIIFGGARGGDTIALEACLNISPRPRLVVIVPDVLAAQPKETQDLSQKADELIELRNKIEYPFDSYQIRNQAMVDRADKVEAFWNFNQKSGTWNCIRYALGKKKLRAVWSVAN